MIVVVVLGVVVFPFIRFFRLATRRLVSAESKIEGNEIVRRGLVDFERDMKDMNEVITADRLRLDFYMDSVRLPSYSPEGNLDSDELPNRLDPDDDGDGWVGVFTARDFLSLDPTLTGTGWRQGLDLSDDDDDNDGKRDVICSYEFNPLRQVVERRFRFNESDWTEPVVIFDRVESFSFHYAARPTAPGIPINADGNVSGVPDGVVDEAELDSLNGTKPGILPLVDFEERRFIGEISFKMTTFSRLKNEKSTDTAETVYPPLLEAKEKYP